MEQGQEHNCLLVLADMGGMVNEDEGSRAEGPDVEGHSVARPGGQSNESRNFAFSQREPFVFEAWEHSETQWTELTDRSMDRTEDSLYIGSGSFSKDEGPFATFEWDSLGDGYYTRSEVREFAELVTREQEEQRNVELSTEHVRKWIKCAVQSPPPRVLPPPACG
jgi:hypothetical protein